VSVFSSLAQYITSGDKYINVTGKSLIVYSSSIDLLDRNSYFSQCSTSHSLLSILNAPNIEFDNLIMERNDMTHIGSTVTSLINIEILRGEFKLINSRFSQNILEKANLMPFKTSNSMKRLIISDCSFFNERIHFDYYLGINFAEEIIL
jgi:hypothetical protein